MQQAKLGNLGEGWSRDCALGGACRDNNGNEFDL